MEELKKTVCSLVYIKKKDRLLLARKKRGFGVGRFNGVGGKMKEGETITQTMLRETMEEVGIVPLDYSQVAVLIFDEYVKDNRELVEVDVFMAESYTGEVTESEEMQPQWFDINDLPYDDMFPDDRFFLPQLLAGKKVKGFFKYDKDFNMLGHEIEIVDKL